MEFESELFPERRRGLDEVAFCRELIDQIDLAWENGAYFTRQGRLEDEMVLRQYVYDRLSHRYRSGLGRQVDSVMRVLQMEAAKRPIPLDETTVHLANGSWNLAQGFSDTLRLCRYRLPVRFDPCASNPNLWLSFLQELLEPEDIPILQEFMGYCLIPTNIAQKMLIIVGRGGEGKSRIGMVMRSLLGSNMNIGSLHKVESSPFARADLEHKLLLVDDDMNLAQLPSTHHTKTIITAESAMDLERKGVQSYQGQLHCRLMGFGNGGLHGKGDGSYAFYRRQLILRAREKNPDRVDDPYLGRRLCQEKEKILLWCLTGLQRLFENDFQFTQSHGSQRNLDRAMEEGNPIQSFLGSMGYLHFGEGLCATSRQLYRAYRDWSEDNGFEILAQGRFNVLLREQAESFRLRYDNNIPAGNGRRVRGYRGVGILPRT